jgi:hypothetical protein
LSNGNQAVFSTRQACCGYSRLRLVIAAAVPCFFRAGKQTRKRCKEEMSGVTTGAGMAVYAVAAFSSTPAAKKAACRLAFQGLEMHWRGSHMPVSGCSTEVRYSRYRLLL